jgi:thioredoxin 1
VIVSGSFGLRLRASGSICSHFVYLSSITVRKEIQAMSENVKEISDADFQEVVLQSDTPTLVDFWAPWCGPCKSIAPILEEIATEYSGKLQIVKMNVDENPATPSQYSVRGIPNLVFFKGGEVVEQVVGAVPKEQLVGAVEKVV